MHDSSNTPSPLGHYRQVLISPERRRHITVARQHIVDDTMDRLKGSITKKSKHHFLFIGPRGIGKSHLLSLIEDGIAADPELKRSYLVARFPEESHRTLSFADFLLGLCDILREMVPDEKEWAQHYEALQIEEEDDRIIDTLVPAIRRANETHGRTTLVMLENINEVFTRQIKNKKDIRAMRKFFMDANGCLLVATTPIHFDGITSVDEPFYDFFDTQIIDHLSEEETITLIHKNLVWEKREELLADFDSLRPKLRALYRMTAGSPRLTVMLYELIAYDSITKIRQQFEVLLDRITPFYQDRLNELAPQERALLETIARMRNVRKTPSAIAARMRLPQNQTSSILKRLTDANYLRADPVPEDKRSRIYSIREGFFDIWLAMNLSRSARKRLPFLLDFFATFYPTIEERNRKRAELAARNEADALASLDYLSDLGSADEKRRSKIDLAGRLHLTGNKSEAMSYLRETYELESGQFQSDYLGEIEEMIACWDRHREGDLEAFSTKLEDLGESLTYKSWSETKIAFLSDQLEVLEDSDKRVQLRIQIASLLADLTRYTEAEILLRKAQKDIRSASPILSTVLNNLAQILKATNRLEEAEPMMREALSIAQVEFGLDDPHVSTQLNNLALLLQATNRMEEAEQMMLKALEIDRLSLGIHHPNVAVRLSNLAQLCASTNRFEEAEPMMREALQIDQAEFGPNHPNVAIRLINLAWLLQETNRFEAAEPMMREALRIDQEEFGQDHPNVATDLNNLAMLLSVTNRNDEAEPMLRKALNILKEFRERNGHAHPETRKCVDNYHFLLEEMKMPKAEIFEKIQEIRKQVGLRDYA